MLKNILELKGAQQLSKNEQNAIHGGDCIPENCASSCSFQCMECRYITYSCPGGYIDCFYCMDGNT